MSLFFPFNDLLHGKAAFQADEIKSIAQAVDWDADRFLNNLPDCRTQRPVTEWANSDVVLPTLFPRKDSALALSNPEQGLYRLNLDRNIGELANHLTKHREFMVIGNDLAAFQPPCWRILSKQSASRSILEMLRETVDARTVEFLTPYVALKTWKTIVSDPQIEVLDDIPRSDPHLLCCQDGVYQWPEGKVLPPDSSFLHFSHLEVSAHDIAPTQTPFFDIFITNLAQDDETLRDLILKVIGAIITGYPVKNFFVFLGERNTGKSQIAGFLEDVLGPTAHFPVNGINQLADRWTSAMLRGKLLCTCGDVPNAELGVKTMGLIKELTGGDTINGEIKYGSMFAFQNRAKLVFLTNFPLRFRGGMDEALAERMVIVPFRNIVPEERRIPNLREKLFTEAGGIIWQALQALQDFGGFFPTADYSDLVNETSLFHRTNESSVEQFVQSACIFDESAQIPVQELYQAYMRFWGNEHPLTPAAFGKAIHQINLPIEDYRSALERGYRGIRLRMPEEEGNISY